MYQGKAIALKLAGELNVDVTERQKKDAAKELRILSRLRHECVVTVRTANPAVHADRVQLVACMRPAEEMSSNSAQPLSVSKFCHPLQPVSPCDSDRLCCAAHWCILLSWSAWHTHGADEPGPLLRHGSKDCELESSGPENITGHRGRLDISSQPECHSQ